MKTLSEKVFVLAAVLLCAIACNRGEDTVESGRPLALMTRRDVARMLSLLPLGSDQLREVYDAVSSSTANGYDEEYMMSDLLTAPGAGVGDVRGKSRKQLYSTPIRSLIED